jgi:hypothetical protein
MADAWLMRAGTSRPYTWVLQCPQFDIVLTIRPIDRWINEWMMNIQLEMLDDHRYIHDR